jgi:hypothetical protein
MVKYGTGVETLACPLLESIPGWSEEGEGRRKPSSL